MRKKAWRIEFSYWNKGKLYHHIQECDVLQELHASHLSGKQSMDYRPLVIREDYDEGTDN